jgi:hypothetical protein
MNAATESADAVQAVSEAGEPRPCLDVEGSKVCAELNEDGVLVVKVHLAGDTPAAVYVGEALVAGSEVDWQPAGRHRRPV